MTNPTDYRQQPQGWAPGIYELESYQQYASIQALRSSELKKLSKSPAHYRAAVTLPRIISPQLERTFAKGKAFDVLILHGRQAFESLVVVEPPLHRATKAYKDWKARNAGAECVLSAAEKQSILAMGEAAFQKEQFSKIFAGSGFSHRVIVWRDSRSGLWCKAEIDWICADGTVIDLKSTADAGFWFFSRNAARLQYANQGAYYLDGLTQLTGIAHQSFQLAAVEVAPPYESNVFRVSAEQLINAQVKNEESMMLLKKCLDDDSWPGYPDQILDLETGQYNFDDYEEEEGETMYGF